MSAVALHLLTCPVVPASVEMPDQSDELPSTDIEAAKTYWCGRHTVNMDAASVAARPVLTAFARVFASPSYNAPLVEPIACLSDPRRFP